MPSTPAAAMIAAMSAPLPPPPPPPPPPPLVPSLPPGLDFGMVFGGPRRAAPFFGIRFRRERALNPLADLL